MPIKKSKGKATIIKNGDVTTVRVVNDHGRPPEPARDLAAGMPAPPPDLQTLKHLDLSQSAEAALITMREYLCEKMPDGVPILGARAEAAFRLGISTETAKRYIEKWCYAFSAPFYVRDGVIFRKQEVSDGNESDDVALHATPANL